MATIEHQQKLQQEEEEVGRRVTYNIDRERARWEAIYGNGSQQEPSIDTYYDSSQTSSTLREKDEYSSASLEMHNFPGTDTAGMKSHRQASASKRASRVPSVTVTALEEEDEIQQIDANGRPIVSTTARVHELPDAFELAANSTQCSSDAVITGETRSSIRSSPNPLALVPPLPAVVPLPFRIPDEDNSSEENDNTSVSVIADSVPGSPPRRRWSKRLSGTQRFERLSNSSSVPDEQEEALIIPHVEFDRSSSIAATLDQEFDRLTLRNLSAPPSPTESLNTIKGEASANDQKRSDVGDSEHASPLLSCTMDTGGPGFSDQPPTELSRTTQVRAAEPVTELAEPQPLDRGSKASYREPDTQRASFTRKVNIRTSQSSVDCTQTESDTTTPTSGNKQGFGTPPTSEAANKTNALHPCDRSDSSPSFRTQPLARLSREALPQKLSKVASSYRTNEWAKHLDSAEDPEVEEPIDTVKTLPDDKNLDEGSAQEYDMPRSGHATPLSTVLQPTEHLVMAETQMKPIALPAISESQPLHTNLALRHASLMPSPMSRENSQATDYSSRKAVRSTSMPLSAHSLEVPPAARISNVPSPRLSNTLLEVRETLKRNKSASPSLTPLTTSPLSSSPNLLAALDHENMTLAQRKQMIHQQKLPSPSPQWGPSSPVLSSQPRPFDSHQPRRTSAGVDPARREAMLAGWRESMRQDGQLGQKTAPVELEHSRRAALLDEKRKKEIASQERAMKAQQRESAMESMMRSGQMLEAHREAMRRMQAKANRNV